MGDFRYASDFRFLCAEEDFRFRSGAGFSKRAVGGVLYAAGDFRSSPVVLLRFRSRGAVAPLSSSLDVRSSGAERVRFGLADPRPDSTSGSSTGSPSGVVRHRSVDLLT